MTKKKLLVDFDDTICQSVFLKKVNEFLGTDYKLENFTDYFIDEVVPKEKRQDYFNEFLKTNPYEGVGLINGAKEALKKLSKYYDIYVCSACVMPINPVGSAKLFGFKYDYILKELPFLDPSKFVFTSSKDIICGDVFIDDYLHNLNGNIPTKLLFTTYHNKHFTEEELCKRGVTRVESWKEICQILIENKRG